MNIKHRIAQWLLSGLIPAAPAPKKDSKPRPTAEAMRAMAARVRAAGELQKIKREVKPPELLPGVIPRTPGEGYMALDAQPLSSVYQYANCQFAGCGFMGYPVLSELTQISEYRSPSETAAQEMTRKWVRFTTTGKGDKADKVAKLEKAFKTFKVRDVFRLAAAHDGLFGHGQVYIRIDEQMDDERRALPLIIDPATIKKGSFLGFTNVEPIWTSPYAYNAIDPTAPDFYRPSSWYILGKKTSASRLLSFISRPVPDILKPAYNFGGLSMTQLMEPYVNSWIRTRQSISDLVHSFSTSGLATDLNTLLQGPNGAPDDLLARADLFATFRDNQGLMLLNKAEEEFFQFNVPLSGLHELQAQAQEQMAAPSHTPLVKLLGITPSGLNANSDGEIRVYNDYIHAQQEAIFRHPLNRVLQIIQLHEFGEIDPDIGFEFESLFELDGTQLATNRKSDADAAAAYIDRGVLAPEEVREQLAADPNSGYENINVDDVPPPPGDPDAPENGGEPLKEDDAEPQVV